MAFFSASSKSMPSPGVTFLTPSLFVFLAPRTDVLRGPVVVAGAVLRMAEDVVVLETMGVVSSPPGGVLARSIPASPAGFKKGLAVRVAGVALLEGGFDGRLIVGLSQDEKKSSAGSLDGVDMPSISVGESRSVITTSSGNSF